jgi:hypothetical protein
MPALHERPIFETKSKDGETLRFQLKRTTKGNHDRMIARFGTPDEPLLEMGEWDQYLELLRFITDPLDGASYDDVDVDDLDVNEVQQLLASFMPQLTVTLASLVGYSATLQKQAEAAKTGN